MVVVSRRYISRHFSPLLFGCVQNVCTCVWGRHRNLEAEIPLSLRVPFESVDIMFVLQNPPERAAYFKSNSGFSLQKVV
jgi:hypothetical protein